MMCGPLNSTATYAVINAMGKESERLARMHTFKSGNSITQAHSTTWAPARSVMKKTRTLDGYNAENYN